jgi:hypothetical protein
MPGPPGRSRHSEALRWPAYLETNRLPGLFLVVVKPERFLRRRLFRWPRDDDGFNLGADCIGVALDQKNLAWIGSNGILKSSLIS